MGHATVVRLIGVGVGAIHKIASRITLCDRMDIQRHVQGVQ